MVWSYDLTNESVSKTLGNRLVITIIVMYLVSTKRYLNLFTILTHGSDVMSSRSYFAHDCVVRRWSTMPLFICGHFLQSKW